MGEHVRMPMPCSLSCVLQTRELTGLPEGWQQAWQQDHGGGEERGQGMGDGTATNNKGLFFKIHKQVQWCL